MTHIRPCEHDPTGEDHDLSLCFSVIFSENRFHFPTMLGTSAPAKNTEGAADAASHSLFSGQRHVVSGAAV